jgi:predicted Ser/Thr protein kinase
MDRIDPLGSAATLPPTPMRSQTAIATPPGAGRGEVPARIGRYIVLDELGAGGMGVVYAAYDPELDRKVAIKLMYTDADGAPRRSQALLLREAQVLARLSHPNIVGIHDVGEHAGQVFVAMEFVAGRTLRQWRDEAPRTWQAVVDAFLQAGRGLMAAHAASLVHRDVKPDNLLIGDDGRVRVADFGVARFTSDDEVPTTSDASRPLATVAGRGAVVGTPAYMAPEQHANDGVGPHSDQFSFCVALYEALHGMRPFAGDSAASRIAAMRGGPPRRPPGPTRVPPWLDRAVLRGLSPRPEDRWPTLQALLDVLAVDPDELRARRRRRAGLAALVLAAAVLLVLGARALVARHDRAQLERAAAERLAVVADGVDRLLARGERAAAEDAVRTFVGEPEHRDTAAVADAWLLWADRMDAARDGAASLAALVEAYTALAEGDPREPALFLRIGRSFHARWRFPELSTLAEHAAQRWPLAVREPAWAELRADAALARRDLAAHLAAVEDGLAGPARRDAAPAVRALDELRFPPVDGVVATLVDLEGDGRRELAVFADDGGAGHPLRIHRADTDATLLHDLGRDHPIDGSIVGQLPLHRAPGEPAHMLAHHLVDGVSTVSLFELRPGGPRPVLSWPDDPPQSAAAADLDGDGAREFYVGTGAYTRALHRITRDADGRWRREPAHPATERLHSDFNALAPGDYDGDGRDELAVALGPWSAYDVRVLEADPGGGLRVGARWRVGHVRALARVRAGDGSDLLALVKDDGATSKYAFSPDKPHGEPSGLYVVRRRGAALEPVFHAPLPAPEGAARDGHVRWVGAGDLDGDGLEDVIVRYEPPEPRRDFATALVWRQLADGRFALAPLGRLIPVAVGQFDADAADELLVVTPGDGGREALAVLGAGGPPALALATPQARVAPPPVDDPVLARTWSRAEDLAGFGLYAAAAGALERRLSLARSRDDGRVLRLRAAELYAIAGDPGRAAALLESLAGDGDEEAALRAIDAYEQALRFVDALRVADALLQRPGLPPAARERARVARERAAAVVERRDALELRFDRALDEGWQIHEPLALRLDPVARDLAVEAFADVGDLMTLPVDLTGGPLTLELELDVERAEWGAALAVQLRREDGEVVATMGVAATGGGGMLDRHDTFFTPDTHGRHHFGVRATDDDPGVRTRHLLQFRVLPAQRIVSVEERGDHPAASSFPLLQELRPGRHALALRSTGATSHGPQLLRARVRRISVAGARAAPPPAPPDATARAARALVVGDPRLVLASAGEAPLWRAAAALALGRLPEARAALAALDPAEPVARAHLRHLLRGRAPLAGPLLRDALGPAFPELLREALFIATRMHPDEAVQREWLVLGADLEALPEDDPARLDTKAELLRMRALAYRALGDLDRAAADLAHGADLRARVAGLRDDPLAELELLRAEVDAQRRRPADAVAAARRALDRASEPGWMAERLRMSPRLGPLHADAGWQRALAAYP